MGEIKAIETVYNGYRFRSRLEARWAVFFDALGVEYEYEPQGFVLPSGKHYLPDFKIKCYGTRGGFTDPCEIPIFPCLDCKHHIGSNVDFSSWFDLFCEYCNPEKDYDSPPQWLKLRENHTEIIECKRREAENEPFDLWIEVKGKMTQTDADKIHEFAGRIVNRGAWSEYVIENPVLVVGGIPNPDTYHDGLHNYEGMDGIRIYPWNYETIDGDYFAAFPAAKNGHFYLDGDDSNYTTMNPDVIRDAFIKARQARFEHGETPTV